MKRHAPNLTIGIVVVMLIAGAVAVFYSNQRTSFPSSAVEKNTNNRNLSDNTEVYTSTESGEIYTPQPASAGATPVPSPAPLDSYIYPGSTEVSTGSSKLELESKDDASKVTNWYKEKIRSSNFNAKSFTQTSTNGTVLNRLSAVKPGEKIDITIKKDQNVSTVSITVDRS
jgi:hypothetical protein